MADSTLDPDRTTPPKAPKGHGTSALGPSDSSDSGSDLIGPGLNLEAGLDLGDGTTSDLARTPGAGADVGDANLDSDSDAGGTGEAASAGRDSDGDAPDISPDRVIGRRRPRDGRVENDELGLTETAASDGDSD